MAQIAKLYVHRDQWTESVIPSAEQVVWNAHRPVRGDSAWQGKSLWGVHYATADRDDVRFDFFEESNFKDDAREVEVITNFRALELAMERNAAAGSSYGLDVYVGELGHEGAKEFVHRWELPWSDTDVTGNVLIARLSGGAA